MRNSLLLSASVVLATLASAEPSLWRAGYALPRSIGDVDRHFARSAARSVQAEVELSRLALSNGTEQVRSLAQRIQADHEKSGAELKTLAGRRQLALDAKLTPEHRQARETLSGLVGLTFDRVYIDHMLRGHSRAIADFERYSQEGRDPELKAFAEKSLTTLRAQLKLTAAARGDDGY